MRYHLGGRRGGRRAGDVVGLLLFFLLAGVDALVRLPARVRARVLSRSAEARRKRKLAERELRALADEFVRESPWGPPVRTKLVDRCSAGGGRNFFDQHRAPRPVLTCTMRLDLHFLVDGRRRVGWTHAVDYHKVWGKGRRG
ncbi:hypothetical protein [Streptomyces sp. NPDC056144]|uniref:hypothetical protein n=1 Tax=unclassified Streptomyces TaxID=2593676 RepID=UPI0035DF92CF